MIKIIVGASVPACIAGAIITGSPWWIGAAVLAGGGAAYLGGRDYFREITKSG